MDEYEYEHEMKNFHVPEKVFTTKLEHWWCNHRPCTRWWIFL